MRLLICRRNSLCLIGALGLAGAVVAAGGLYVTHRERAGPPLTGPGLGTVELGYRTGAYSVMLERGSSLTKAGMRQRRAQESH
jgi:hypothetical protein